ncbi:hypothetical protein ACROYT_G036250 [Oculina patagonica]
MKRGFAVFVFALCLLAASAMPYEQKDMNDDNKIEKEPVKRGGTECGWGIGGCPPFLVCMDGYCKLQKCEWSCKVLHKELTSNEGLLQKNKKNQTTKPHSEKLRASR